MTQKVIKCLGRADGTPYSGAGMFLKSFDAEKGLGAGVVAWTPEVGKAKVFKNAMDAMNFYRTRSRGVPDRDDGKPNRPLTAFHVAIEDKPT